MIRLSVNVNKIATLRNSRGGDEPSVLRATQTCIDAGAHGITVHPRADLRHIRPDDVLSLADMLKDHPDVEYNIEGDPRRDWLDLVLAVRPHQATLVPVRPGEVTSDHGYTFPDDAGDLREPVARLTEAGIRVSVFVEAGVPNLDLARKLGIDRIELYTGPFAHAFDADPDQAREHFDRHAATARKALDAGLGINAGHDLNLRNLVMYRSLPGLAEVSIGHAIVCDALEIGLAATVRAYLHVLATGKILEEAQPCLK